ncbi:1-aminocyclopropane-1-carboxylate deaminase/D-cysteine desulfhydrase [Chitinophaga tropicalis]|uniref:Pyridoxal-phosphate dependent enzyme n=1 Tax=Chitinophaga tropicalis TaxID=2683588 RepID=A0A7K1U748_9BACT|nr:pyridoxal-phosphate dependent enzyme [Chitinophaga tropicalis]MVT10182.1 pyridoxal-phosphate dependent enzyme [Chitinophaga tropicalis]
MQFNYSNIILQQFKATWLPDTILAAMLRLDLLHPEVSGNKWFKLKYNLIAAAAQGKSHILTFGGAYSNHIAATAAACQLAGLTCTGIIRGEKPPVLSHTLQEAMAKGMQLQFISREAYRHKNTTDWASLFPDAFIVPEGGNNAAGAKGCEEILTLADTSSFTHIACACGTGTTLAGLINSALPAQELRGYPVLKGAEYLEQEVSALITVPRPPLWQLVHEHHGGGYAKVPAGLKEFMEDFFIQTGIPLDIVYTGKLVRGVCEDIKAGKYPSGSRILLIHTGGLQGNPLLS